MSLELPSILTEDLKSAMPFVLKLNKIPGCYSGKQFFDYLNRLEDCELFVVTYTVTLWPFKFLKSPVKKLIYETGGEDIPVPKKKLAHLHTKLVLVREGKRIKEVFSGSQNFVAPTQHNLMFRLPREYHKYCRDYINQLWKI